MHPPGGLFKITDVHALADKNMFLTKSNSLAKANESAVIKPCLDGHVGS